MMTLNDAKLKHRYKIESVTFSDPKFLRRIAELGFTRGQVVSIKYRSLLKEVGLVEVRGYLVSMKANLLKGIFVREI